MSAVGGSVQEVSIAGQGFAVASDADVGLILGGWKNTTHKNGSGTTRVTSEWVDWSLSDIALSIDTRSNQLAFLQSVANEMELVPCVITLADGSKYAGDGILVGDLELSTANTTMPVTLSGTGQLLREE